jgi:hypothetical protein
MRHAVAVAFVLGLASVPALAADEYPSLKAGQWEMTTTTSRAAASAAAPIKSTLCTDASVQKEMASMGAGMRREMCSKSDIRHEGNRYVTDSNCAMGDTKITSHSVMTMQGDTAYKTEVHASYDPPFMGMKESATTVEGKFVGPCRDGLQPGDFVTATGQKINMKNIADRKPGSAPPAPATNK